VFPLVLGNTSTVTVGNSARESLVVHTGGRHCATFFFPRAAHEPLCSLQKAAVSAVFVRRADASLAVRRCGGPDGGI
jgi:hypothetical protein